MKLLCYVSISFEHSIHEAFVGLSLSTCSYSRAELKLSPNLLISLEVAASMTAELLTPTPANWGQSPPGHRNDSNRRELESHLEWRLHDSPSGKTQTPSLRIKPLSPAWNSTNTESNITLSSSLRDLRSRNVARSPSTRTKGLPVAEPHWSALVTNITKLMF